MRPSVVASRDEHAQRLADAMTGLEAAKVERDAAVTAALKSDLSVRTVALLSGLSTRTVQNIGHANGWPTPAQRKRWDEKKVADSEWIARYAPGFKRDRDTH